METLIGLVVAAPLLGAAVLLTGGRRLDRAGHLLGTLLALLSFVFGVVLFTDMLGKDSDARALHSHLFTWVPVGGFRADVGFQLDQLSMTFVLLITGVGTLIHIYSIGYMKEDERRRRFFGYLNLFLAAMLLLVLADNYLLLYAGWEGVGLASYLLIGFWQHKPSAATAAKKAFLVNRVGDIGLSVAIMLMFTTFGSFAFGDVLPRVGQASGGQHATITGIGFMLLLAACGKSAQVPLQSWLGDAMEGPTPVSALIHAATMVTAGVYLITRSGAIFNAAPDAQTAVVTVGAVTLLYGAIVGCAKDDIKKALAGSTMSQIGYMIMAAGLGPIGYVFAIMHLVTHGFFKAGLFLGAGSVMHGMNDEVDMRRYGGLRSYMPITFITFGLGYLAIIGFPGLSGFFSKDKIIEAAFAKGGTEGWILGTAGLVGAAVTAFYMTRVMLMTFFGKARWKEAAAFTGDASSAAPGTFPPAAGSTATVTGPSPALAGGHSSAAAASVSPAAASPSAGSAATARVPSSEAGAADAGAGDLRSPAAAGSAGTATGSSPALAGGHSSAAAASVSSSDAGVSAAGAGSAAAPATAAGAHGVPHPHESPASMTVPMIILALGSVFAGAAFSINSSFVKWLEPVTGHSEGDSPVSAGTVTAATLVVLVIGVALAWLMYGRREVPAVAPRGSLLTRAARRDLLQDDFNHVVLVRGGEHLTRSLVYLDHSLVDGVVNGTAASVGGLSGRLRKLQNGYVRSYAVSMLGGTAVLVAATLLMRAV